MILASKINIWNTMYLRIFHISLTLLLVSSCTVVPLPKSGPFLVFLTISNEEVTIHLALDFLSIE